MIVDDLPKSFGRYELLELLATGGMAHIFRARLASARGTEKELVIKRVLPHLTQNRDFIDMFIDEARISMPLNHGNIVQVFEFGQEGNDFFLAMEYVRGRNLETVLERMKLAEDKVPFPVALFIAAEVAKGLAYAHRFRDPHDRPSGIIHRDVSPQNVLVGFQGEVKLTDFGIAKARSRIRSTAQGIIRGKACYLSPEQAECRELDGRSDLFSLGVVLYEMLTGTRPFEGLSEIETLAKVRQAAVQAPSRLRADIPSELDGAVLKCLNRDPERRFADTGGLQVVLSRILHEQAPGFTSAELAQWMRAYFSEDINRETIARTTRERMLQRLAREGDSSGATLSTGEILQMGTLSIKAGDTRKTGSRRWMFLIPLLVVLGLGLVIWLSPALRASLFGQGPDGGSIPDAGVISAGDSRPVAPDAGAEQEASPGGDGRVAADEPRAADRTATVRPPARYGQLNINSRPWAYVWLDGRRLPGETPLFGVRARVGKHRLRFYNPELKIEKIKVVRVRHGRTTPVSIELTE